MAARRRRFFVKCALAGEEGSAEGGFGGGDVEWPWPRLKCFPVCCFDGARAQRTSAGRGRRAVPSSSAAAPRPLLLLPPAVLRPRFFLHPFPHPFLFSGMEAASNLPPIPAYHVRATDPVGCSSSAILPLQFLICFSLAPTLLPRTFPRCVEGLSGREQLARHFPPCW